MQLQELFTDLEIQYVHPINRGTPTRIPDNVNSRASVINLVAASAALIDQEGFHYKVKRYQSRGICGEIGRMMENAFGLAEDLEVTMERVSVVFKRAWEAYSEERKPSHHGKKWWNEECKKVY
ncbi:hypothetical protein AGABI2DRAFT_122512 [Agaricus bisporus var. bisporus H97]|uniref:hypothetical protein n=1 Tax=Agaricus bisporus var. bisporus (strain H97 / ATCC MYA-4626 / FGSC 10389) TaxID=936046 RepID=UPI00029F5BD9|nr:hypothetical protein AGABI2DRAFT_122512 [Agaricus bisporus var. bisporus H97]EKV42946.1 hypothetical protein AGABI2DRAFT_122512 [Agaricus bisporus var. bisporus H97]